MFQDWKSTYMCAPHQLRGVGQIVRRRNSSHVGGHDRIDFDLVRVLLERLSQWGVSIGKGRGFQIVSTDNSDQPLVGDNWKMFYPAFAEQSTCVSN